ncbi:hypothetical protein ACFVY1_42985 [Streptomyces sp. NPDC058293]|uniref:hypothetical protein n=1 Tax=Streptomyces sp. NPDC058293 TaxID=3346429 RepID=UPI0036E46053
MTLWVPARRPASQEVGFGLVFFPRLAQADIIPLTHAIWATAETELLEHIEVRHADGSMHEWTKVTYYALKGLRHFHTDTVDMRVADWALAQC